MEWRTYKVNPSQIERTWWILHWISVWIFYTGQTKARFCPIKFERKWKGVGTRVSASGVGPRPVLWEPESCIFWLTFSVLLLVHLVLFFACHHWEFCYVIWKDSIGWWVPREDHEPIFVFLMNPFGASHLYLQLLKLDHVLMNLMQIIGMIFGAASCERL